MLDLAIQNPINFLGHTDVVTNLDNWSVPIQGTIRNGQIISRGIADIRGSIACWISKVISQK